MRVTANYLANIIIIIDRVLETISCVNIDLSIYLEYLNSFCLDNNFLINKCCFICILLTLFWCCFVQIMLMNFSHSTKIVSLHLRYSLNFHVHFKFGKYFLGVLWKSFYCIYVFDGWYFVQLCSNWMHFLILTVMILSFYHSSSCAEQ